MRLALLARLEDKRRSELEEEIDATRQREINSDIIFFNLTAEPAVELVRYLS
jgi:hypothetical protein